MKKILLLGATGQLGTAIREVFGKTPFQLSCPKRAEFDAQNDTVEKSLSVYGNHDYLINCVAFHKVDRCEKDPDLSFRLNASFALDLARFCSTNNMTFIHISTDYVFDGRRREAYNETDQPAPLNVYGVSKLAGEYLVRAYAPKHFVLRVSSLFGVSGRSVSEENFIEKMVSAARAGREINVIKDQIMSPTYTIDAALAIKALIEKDITAYGIYHVCNGGECSWYDYARKIFELTGLSNKLMPVTYKDFHTEAVRPQFCSMNNSKISGIFKMRPWPVALREYLAKKGYLSQ